MEQQRRLTRRDRSACWLVRLGRLGPASSASVSHGLAVVLGVTEQHLPAGVADVEQHFGHREVRHGDVCQVVAERDLLGSTSDGRWPLDDDGLPNGLQASVVGLTETEAHGIPGLDLVGLPAGPDRVTAEHGRAADVYRLLSLGFSLVSFATMWGTPYRTTTSITTAVASRNCMTTRNRSATIPAAAMPIGTGPDLAIDSDPIEQVVHGWRPAGRPADCVAERVALLQAAQARGMAGVKLVRRHR